MASRLPAMASSCATVSDSTQVSARLYAHCVSYWFIQISTPNGLIFMGLCYRLEMRGWTALELFFWALPAVGRRPVFGVLQEGAHILRFFGAEMAEVAGD